MEENNFPNIFDEKYEPEPPIDYKRLERSSSDSLIAGVCAGIANYFKVDPSIVRLLAILTLFLGVWTIAVYLLLAYLLPGERNPKKLTDDEIRIQNKINLRTIISGIMIFSGIYFGFSSLGLFSPWYILFVNNLFLISLVSIGMGIFLLEKERENKSSFVITPPVRFARAKEGKLFLGVCSGLARYLNYSDAVTIRTIFIITSMLTLGIMMIAYLIIASFTNYEFD